MNAFYSITYAVLFLVLGLFELWAYRSGRSLSIKLGMLILVFLISLIGFQLAGGFLTLVFLIPIFETAFYTMIAVVIIELVLAFVRRTYDWRLLMLVLLLVVLVSSYFFLRRVI